MLDGDLFLPRGPDRKLPVLVMAPGFAAERAFGLSAFAEVFAARGIAVVTFDYRGFGESEGQPRRLVDPDRHLEDWESALAFARRLSFADASRLALWGTSLSGGHVLAMAARHPDLAAIVAQVPFVGGASAVSMIPLRHRLQGLLLGLADLVFAATGRPPIELPVVHPRGFAAMPGGQSWIGFRRLVPNLKAWIERVPARIAVKLPRYRPARHAARIKASVLMVVARKDRIAPAWAAIRVAKRIPDCRLEILPAGHFDLFAGEYFDQASRLQADFLAKKLYA